MTAPARGVDAPAHNHADDSAPVGERRQDAAAAVTLAGAKQWFLSSRHTGRDYRILVSEPDGSAPTSGWPVLYLLDGNLLFPTAYSLSRITAHAGKRLDLETAAPVVVAIGHVDEQLLHDPARNEDYTPPAPDLSDTGDRSGRAQGGGDRFLDFIEQELKPLVEKRLPIDRERQTLVGHSYGGLLALHALFTRTDAFRNYVAGSPSIWWNHGWILQERDTFLAAHASVGEAAANHQHAARRLLVTVGELEQTPTPQLDGGARDAMIRQRRMVDGARELARSLAAASEHTGLSVAFRELAGANHLGAALPMLIEAFAFLRKDNTQTPPIADDAGNR